MSGCILMVLGLLGATILLGPFGFLAYLFILGLYAYIVARSVEMDD